MSVAQELGEELGKQAKQNNQYKQDFVETDYTGDIAIINLESVSLATSTFVYQQDINAHFVLDHPVNCNLDSSLLISSTFVSGNGLLNSLVSAWEFDTSANDSHGSNNGTVNGAVLTTSSGGVINEGYSFDGVNDYVDSNHRFTSFSSGVSISLWCKTTGIGVGSNEAVWGTGATSDCLFLLQFNPGGSIQVDLSGDGGSPSVTVFGSPSLADQAWHHIAAVYDHSNTLLTLYFDGSVQGSSSIDLSGGANMDRDAFVGARNNNGTADLFFDGVIDMPRVWSKALASNDITSEYNLGSGLAYSSYDSGSAYETVYGYQLDTGLGARTLTSSAVL